MPSLTSILPAIAPVLGLTTQALYERQRALIRLGLLPAPEGRGKRSGATASPDTVALLVVAAMVTDNLSDTDERVRKLAFAPFIDGKKDRCPLSGAAAFKDALSFVLSSAAPASKPGRTFHTSVRVFRNEPAAQIWFGNFARMKSSEFGKVDRRRSDRLRVEAELPNDALNEIRRLLSNEGST
jgi:hypothetical protein